MLATKRSIVCVVANDDERPLQVHLEDMHPNSRIRHVLEHDASSFDLVFAGQRREAFFVNVSRDCMRSMVASQRHNNLICKGETSSVELKNELARDCVDVGEIPVSLGDDEVVRRCRAMCRNLADAIFEWPRLQESRSNAMDGRHCTWTCTPSYFVLQFAPKPPWTANIQSDLLSNRVTRDILTLLCLEDFRSATQFATSANIKQPLLQRDEELCCVRALTSVMQRNDDASPSEDQSPFWYCRHDPNSPSGKLLWTRSGVATVTQIAVKQTLLLLANLWKKSSQSTDPPGNRGFASEQPANSDADDLKGMRICAKLRETVGCAMIEQWSSRLSGRVKRLLLEHPNLSDLLAPTLDGGVTLEQKMMSDAFEMRGYTVTRWLEGTRGMGDRPIVFPSMFCTGDATNGPVCVVKRIA